MKFSIIEKTCLAVIILITASCLFGCADNQITVTKLGLSGQYTPYVNTTVGGYAVGIQGDPTGVVVHYKDGDTTIDIDRGYKATTVEAIQVTK